MNLDLLEKLETKVSAALDTIELLKLELEEERNASKELNQKVNDLQMHRLSLSEENEHLKNLMNSGNAKLNELLNRISDEVVDAL